jgi:hypothetical protein
VYPTPAFYRFSVIKPPTEYLDKIVQFLLNNKTVVQSATHPHAMLHMWHNALSFHWVQKEVVSKYIIMTHMPGADKLPNILSNHWAYQAVYPILMLILFFLGNKAKLIQEG